MITGELKNKIDQLWEMLWTEGNANPLTNIEQLTYLLFMKDLDSVELGRESDAEFLGISYEGIFPKDKPEYRWSTFKNIGDAQEVYRLMTQANSQVNTKVLELLLKFKIKKMNRRCTV